MCKKLLIDFIKKHKVSYVFGIIFLFLNSYVQTLFPKILGNTIDILKVKNFSHSAITTNIVYILLIAVATFLCTFLWRNLIIANARDMECYLREKLYSHLQGLSSDFYSKRKTGDLIAYAINDISAVRMTFGPATAMSINGIVICIISIYSMCQSVSFKLTFLTLIPIPFIVFFMVKIGSLVQKRFRKVQKTFATISDRVQENIYGIRVIKSYVQEDLETEAFYKLNDEMKKNNLDMVKISSSLSPLIELCFSISFVMNIIIGGNMVLKGEISLGNFIAFNTYLTMIMRPVISIGRIINIFQRGTASLKRLNEIFDEVPSLKDGSITPNTSLKGEISFNNLSFKYPENSEPSLKNITLNIKQGQTVGILGKTGSGKTTLSDVLLKLYNVEPNSVFMDGIDLSDLSISYLRDQISYVPQNNFLFSTTIDENIRFFKKNYTKEDVINATKAANIYDSIMDFPLNFETVLGEKGVNLSGGQKQRLSIARALLRNSPILILDDSLSAVDTITEKAILNNLKECRNDKTTFIIAHRISALKQCDLIIVLDDGVMKEHGSHDELLERRGLYYETYSEQES